MEFKTLTLDCMESLKPYFKERCCRICDYTAGMTFLWRDYHGTQYSVQDGVLYLRINKPYEAFAPPLGAESSKAAYERIIEYCAAKKRPALICSVSAEVLEEIREMFPRSIVCSDRAWSDYLYHANDIKDLAGRKFSGQRNHINRFKRENPDWSFERVTADNLHEAKAFIESLAHDNAKMESAAYAEANRKTLEALDNLELYGAFGGVLYANGKTVGVSVGETAGDTLFVHVEKADTDYHGAYPMLVNQFAAMFAGDGIDYINREEDDGVEGLRVSKLSYHPAALLDKYEVELKL